MHLTLLKVMQKYVYMFICLFTEEDTTSNTEETLNTEQLDSSHEVTFLSSIGAECERHFNYLV